MDYEILHRGSPKDVICLPGTKLSREYIYRLFLKHVNLDCCPCNYLRSILHKLSFMPVDIMPCHLRVITRIQHECLIATMCEEFMCDEYKR